MDHQEAHDLLDAARDGVPFHSDDITAALVATGDIDDDMPRRVVHRHAGSWEHGAGMLLAPASWLDTMVPA